MIINLLPPGNEYISFVGEVRYMGHVAIEATSDELEDLEREVAQLAGSAVVLKEIYGNDWEIRVYGFPVSKRPALIVDIYRGQGSVVANIYLFPQRVAGPACPVDPLGDLF